MLPKAEAIRLEDLADIEARHTDEELAELDLLDQVIALREGRHLHAAAEETDEEADASAHDPESPAGDEGEEADEAEAAEQGEDGEPADPEEQPRGPDGKFIPKKALDAERGRRKESEARIARLEAMLERQASIVEKALTGRQPGQQPAQQANPLDAAEAALADLDRRYDAGELDDAAYRTESRTLTRAIARMEAEASLAHIALPLTTGAVAAEVGALADANAGWLNALSDDAWQELLDTAQTKVARTGMTGPAADLEVKRQIVVLGHKFGLAKLADSQPAAARPGSSPTSAKLKPAAVQHQAQRTAEKLQAASRLPPDTGKAGVARAGAADDPEGAFARLSQKELMRRTGMPTATTHRLLDAIPDA